MPTQIEELQAEFNAFKTQLEANTKSTVDKKIEELKGKPLEAQETREFIKKEVDTLVLEKITGYAVKFGIANAVVAAGLIWAIVVNSNSVAKKTAEIVAAEKVNLYINAPLQAFIIDLGKGQKNLGEVLEIGRVIETKETELNVKLENLQATSKTLESNYSALLKSWQSDYVEKIRTLNTLTKPSTKFLNDFEDLKGQLNRKLDATGVCRIAPVGGPEALFLTYRGQTQSVTVEDEKKGEKEEVLQLWLIKSK